MFRLFSLFTTLCVFTWFLPLGAFIKPSQEKLACDGQRAFHMCTCITEVNNTGKQTTQRSNFSASNTEPLSKTSSFGGTDIILADSKNDLLINTTSKMNELCFKLKAQPFFPSIDHPPQR